MRDRGANHSPDRGKWDIDPIAPVLDLRPWLNDPTHVLLVTRVSWTGFAPLVPGSSSLSLLPCVEGASAGVGGENGRSEEEACCALGVASRRSVSQSKEGPRVYLSHRLSLAVGIGATGVPWQPTCSLESHLTVRCVRPGANVSWQSHRHRPAPQPYLPEGKVEMGSVRFSRSVSV
eukprot:scaffold997_cov333-Pavlova_lutheri.AAC.8